MIHSAKRHFNMDDFFQSNSSDWTKANNEHYRGCGGQTENPFLLFCDVILKYEKYKDHDELNDSAYSPSSCDRTSDSFSSEGDSGISSEDRDTPGCNGATYEYVQKEQDYKTDDARSKKDFDLITCHCMKPYAGRPMIECAACETWLHMSCAKIRRNNVPDVFICQLCRDTTHPQARAGNSKRRSQRIKSDDRRLFS